MDEIHDLEFECLKVCEVISADQTDLFHSITSHSSDSDGPERIHDSTNAIRKSISL